MDTNKDKGLRYNEGKIRFDLLEANAIEELAKIFTKGSEKYLPRNWEKGMAWSKVVASLKRHLNEFEKGEDFDPETKCYHITHAAWNALALTSYYKIYPQGDDRPHFYLNHPKIGLDIDEVLAAWTRDWCKYWKCEVPNSWHFDRNIMEKFDKMKESGTLDEFYLNLSILTSPDDIPFEPHCYVTSRPVSREITEQWLDRNGYPSKPVYCVGLHQSKVEAMKETGCEIFVDDRFDNFVELNKAGICTFLFDAPHNRRYDVGYKRIKSLSELMKRV